PILNRYGRPSLIGHRLYKIAEVINATTPDAMYRKLVSHWQDTNALIPDSRELPTAFTQTHRFAKISDFTHRMMLADTLNYLPDDILVKVDRASMAVSLESRVPFLDHRVVEFAWQIPMRMKFHDGQGKWLLRQVLHKYLPKKLFDRGKMGFGVPIGE